MRQTILLPLCMALIAAALGQSPQPRVQPSQTPTSLEKDGTLIVLVTWGDVDNTPANDVYIEAHGFVPKFREEKSFILKMSRAGEYEASLPQGVYDVFVSEGTSIPRCRRVLIESGGTGYWTLKLEIDEVYTDKMKSGPLYQHR